MASKNRRKMSDPLKSEKVNIRRASVPVNIVPNENSDTKISETSDTKTIKRGSFNLHRRLD